LFYFSERDKIFANMPPKQKREKVTAINNMALKKKKKKVLTKIDSIFETFIPKGNAYYHPVTKKLSYILDGHCIKSECGFRDKDKEKNGFGIRKILLPGHLRKHFQTTTKGFCHLPLDKIGEVVICLEHFFIEHQKEYLQTGVIPLDARLMHGQENISHIEGNTIKPLKPFPVRDPLKKSPWSGIKVSKRDGLENTDWVN
jgi:hypothetical protein